MPPISDKPPTQDELRRAVSDIFYAASAAASFGGSGYFWGSGLLAIFSESIGSRGANTLFQWLLTLT
jgi:hypothetical protein